MLCFPLCGPNNLYFSHVTHIHYSCINLENSTKMISHSFARYTKPYNNVREQANDTTNSLSSLSLAKLTRYRTITVYTCDDTLIVRSKINHSHPILTLSHDASSNRNSSVYTIRSRRFRTIVRCISKWGFTNCN